ncbi:DUF4097 family beta strand repeat protein [Hyphobacterium sp. CCMP332]|nr:DUF4097 family beta strand repeat protein [Hyphobacterium sp. CCMP332]
MVKLKLITIAVLSSTIQLIAQNTYELNEEYSINKNGLITLNTNDANISITGSERENVHIEIYRKVETVGAGSDEEFEIKIEERNGNLFIRELRKSEINYWIGYRNIDYRIKLEVPSTVKMVISEDDGDLSISNISGDLDINCEDGDLELNNISARKLNIDIEDGDVEMNKISGFLSLQSEDGDIEANNCSFSKIDLDTEDGDVNIESSLAKDSEYKLETEDGDIKFYISGSGAKLNLNCEDGNISVEGDFNELINKEGQRQIEFGDKSALVYLNTEDGDIKVSR